MSQRPLKRNSTAEFRLLMEQVLRRRRRVIYEDIKTERSYYHRIPTNDGGWAAVFDYIKLFFDLNRLSVAPVYLRPEQFGMSHQC